MKKLSFLAIVMAMVMVVGCEKENIMDSVSRSDVNPTVVTDTIVNVDTVFVPQVDTLVIDSTTPGQTRLVLDKHLAYGQWSGTGATRTITATHELKTIVIPDGGTAFTADSVVFSEVGTMTWSFPTYDHSVDGNYSADENGCPSLGATCTFTWTYNVPTQYAPYFEGDCEMWPTQVVGNGTTATVVTKHGTTSRTAAFTLNIEGPQQPTVVSRSATWRHLHDCGQWTGSGNTRNITLHCWCVETTNWSDGSTTKDSVLVAGHGTMTWNFPTYDHSVDGNYSASANGCAALQATASVSYTYDVANIQGRTYTHGTACGPMPTTITVNGTTATITTAHGNVTRDAGYTITINIPTPADTLVIFGNIKYVARHYSAVNYYAPAPGDGWYWIVITDDNNWYTSPDAVTASGLNFTNRGTISASDYAYVVSVSNFTDPEKSGSRCCAAWCRNSTAGATANVFSVVKYDPNNGHAQIKYRNTSGALVGVCSAASGTIEASNAVPEPVGHGAVATNFTIGNTVVK